MRRAGKLVTIAAEGRKLEMKKLFVAAGVLLVFCSAGLAASAKVTITQIKASGSGGAVTVDPQLEDLKDRLAKKFRFSQYTFLSSSTKSIASGGTATWSLKNGNFLDMALTGIEGSGNATRYSLKLEFYSKSGGKNKSILTTNVTLFKGKVFAYARSSSETLGGTLILVIKAN